MRDLKLNAGARWPERRGVWVKYTGSYPPCFLSLCVVCKAVRPREHTVETCVLTPVSDIKGLPHLGALLPLDELLRLREPQKWILRPIWDLGGHA